MNPFPTLTTTRLLLRKLSDDDAEAVFALRSDERVNRFLDRQASSSIDDARAFILKISDGIRESKLMYWAISGKESAGLVGTICLFNVDAEKMVAEIGYELLPEFQGRGYMQEALQAVVHFAIEQPGIGTLEAFTHKDNIRSTKLLEKNKFKLEAEYKDAVNPDIRMYRRNLQNG